LASLEKALHEATLRIRADHIEQDDVKVRAKILREILT
jgi:hypothetical protein